MPLSNKTIKDICVVTVYSCLEIYLFKTHCLFLSTMLHSLACIFLVKVTEWPPIGKIAAHSAYDMVHGIKYLIVSLVFSHLGFWSGNLFLIAPFPDLCLLVHFYPILNQAI